MIEIIYIGAMTGTPIVMLCDGVRRFVDPVFFVGVSQLAPGQRFHYRWEE